MSKDFTSKDRIRYAATTETAEILRRFDSRLEGHYNEEVATSRTQYGKNELSSRSSHVILRRLYHSFTNIFIVTLAIIDIIWMIIDPDIIYFVILTTLVLINGTMIFIQETRSSKAASKLINMVTTVITVRRDNKENEISSKELVVGDIVILDTGDIVPADVRIIKTHHLKIDQSSLTGESTSVSKHGDVIEPNDDEIFSYENIAFMGSGIDSGSAEAMVIAVGNDTALGSMTKSLSSKKTSTTYDKGSKEVISLLLKIMVFMVPTVFIVMVVKSFLINDGIVSDDVLEAVLFALTLAIGLMPEMLATVVSTNLAKGAIDMAKRKVIVKDVTSIQNFGAMDILCSDKTGTLTQNKISVRTCEDINGQPDEYVGLLASLNSMNLKSSTNHIDRALMEYEEGNNNSWGLDSYGYVADIPFDFIRKRASVVVSKNGDDNLMVSKGAMLEILSISSYYRKGEEVLPLDEEATENLLSKVEGYSKMGLRVLCVAHKNCPGSKTEYDKEDEHDMIIDGFVVFVDPVKPTARMAIDDMREYGIETKILTGDNEYVTSQVCAEIGLKFDEIITGPRIGAMSDEELRVVVEKNNIFARLTPIDKSRIVIALRNNGHTVGLMGDGINDVLAMKDADVSISVDTGTDIAKETANMILLEKDLGILKIGAIEGRKVYVNSIKYVKMTGTFNFGYMISLILATILFNFEPVGAMMMLFYNLIIDISSMMIPWDTVEDEFVRKPRKWDVPNLKNVMVHCGALCVLTDLVSWTFIIFFVFATIPVEGYTSAMHAVLSDENIVANAPAVVILFQSIWFIEQYWKQAWSIHIVRTNKIPFLQSWSCKGLVVTSFVSLCLVTMLPFTGTIWETISGVEAGTTLMAIPTWTLLWMPFIGGVFFLLMHLMKRHMLKKYGYFAC